MKGFSVYLNAIYGDRPFADVIDRAAALGADAVEFRPWSHEDLPTLVKRASDAGLDVAYLSGGDVAINDPSAMDEAVGMLETTVETAEAVGVPSLNASVGADTDDDPERQREAVLEVLERAGPAAESADVTLLLEPLNRAVDHPDAFLATASQGVELVRAVDSPAVKLVFDVYHEQIAAGNVTVTLTESFKHVAHVHVADVPGRHEPGTGELNYANILAALDDAGYDGYVGMEFFPKGDPDEAVRDTLPLSPR